MSSSSHVYDNPARKRFPKPKESLHLEEDDDDTRDLKNTYSSYPYVDKICPDDPTAFVKQPASKPKPSNINEGPVSTVKESSNSGVNIMTLIVFAILFISVLVGIVYIVKQHLDIKRADLEMTHKLEETKLSHDHEQKIRDNDYKNNELEYKYNQTITRLRLDAAMAQKMLNESAEKAIEFHIKKTEAEKEVRLKELELDRRALELNPPPVQQIDNKEEEQTQDKMSED